MAHGCNSVLATRAALKLADYTVTEAGFGADLGAEKFIDIKCRKAGLKPAAVVIVATLRALKFHGGCDLKQLDQENLAAVEGGMANLERHVDNVQREYGLPCVVSVNRFASDTTAEFRLVQERLSAYNVPVVSASHWADGGAGAEDLARIVVSLAEQPNEGFRFVYDDALPLWDKVKAVATRIYGAAEVTADDAVLSQVAELQAAGYGRYPVCIAKTQYSFSTNPKLRGAPTGHTVNVREVRLAAGAEFVVFICGDLMTMPGLPKEPAAHRIDIDDAGRIIGLS
jgi:formate--tetrahydrofolate ligase